MLAINGTDPGEWDRQLFGTTRAPSYFRLINFRRWKDFTGRKTPIAPPLLSFDRGRFDIDIRDIRIDHVDPEHDIAIGRVGSSTWTIVKSRHGIKCVSLGSSDLDALRGEDTVLIGIRAWRPWTSLDKMVTCCMPRPGL